MATPTKKSQTTIGPIVLDKAHSAMLATILERTALARAAWVRKMIREAHMRLPYEIHADNTEHPAQR